MYVTQEKKNKVGFPTMCKERCKIYVYNNTG